MFLRSPAGDDPQTALWVFDVAERRDGLLVNAVAFLGAPAEELSVQERARRERSRETGGAIVSYAIVQDSRIGAMTRSGRLLVADLVRVKCESWTFQSRCSIRGRIRPASAVRSSTSAASQGSTRRSGK